MEIMNFVYVFLFVILIIIFIIFGLYNKLIRYQNRVKKSRANIEILLNKRFDLIPNIVECVKGYSEHESTTLENIVELRNTYNTEKNLSLSEASNMNDKLNKYLAVVENYPNLKANTQYLDLQSQLRAIEDELAYARRVYNDEVTRYNTTIESVPSNIVASIFAFKKSELFQIEDYKRENNKIDI